MHKEQTLQGPSQTYCRHFSFRIIINLGFKLSKTAILCALVCKSNRSLRLECQLLFEVLMNTSQMWFFSRPTDYTIPTATRIMSQTTRPSECLNVRKRNAGWLSMEYSNNFQPPFSQNGEVELPSNASRKARTFNGRLVQNPGPESIDVAIFFLSWTSSDRNSYSTVSDHRRRAYNFKKVEDRRELSPELEGKTMVALWTAEVCL